MQTTTLSFFAKAAEPEESDKGHVKNTIDWRVLSGTRQCHISPTLGLKKFKSLQDRHLKSLTLNIYNPPTFWTKCLAQMKNNNKVRVLNGNLANLLQSKHSQNLYTERQGVVNEFVKKVKWKVRHTIKFNNTYCCKCHEGEVYFKRQSFTWVSSKYQE